MDEVYFHINGMKEPDYVINGYLWHKSPQWQGDTTRDGLMRLE